MNDEPSTASSEATSPASNARSKRRSILAAAVHSLVRFDLRFLLAVTTLAAVSIMWYRDRERMEKRIAALEARFNPSPFVGPYWGTIQATGEPDTKLPGDQPTAWASASPDGGTEWLELTYARSVKPYEIEVHESYNPGAVTKITGFDQFGNEGVLWQGTDPTPPGSGSGVSKFAIKKPFVTAKIRVYLASDQVPGWNEIDAVGLSYGWLGATIWAEKATASSSYADTMGGYPMRLR